MAIRSTQEANPDRATWRTALQTGVAAFIGLLVILPLIIQTVIDGPLKEYLTPEVYAWLAGAAAFITAVSATIARVMAVPGVNEWLRKHARKFAPDHKPADQP